MSETSVIVACMERQGFWFLGAEPATCTEQVTGTGSTRCTGTWGSTLTAAGSRHGYTITLTGPTSAYRDEHPRRIHCQGREIAGTGIPCIDGRLTPGTRASGC